MVGIAIKNATAGNIFSFSISLTSFYSGGVGPRKNTPTTKRYSKKAGFSKIPSSSDAANPIPPKTRPRLRPYSAKQARPPSDSPMGNKFREFTTNAAKLAGTSGLNATVSVLAISFPRISLVTTAPIMLSLIAMDGSYTDAPIPNLVSSMPMTRPMALAATPK